MNRQQTTIKALYTNTDNSLLSKLDELKATISSDPPDLICLTEVKPKNGKTPDKELLNLNGYDLHLNAAYTDADTRGVAIYTKSYLNASKLTSELSSRFTDSVWISIPGNSSILVGCIYRSGSPAKAILSDTKLHGVIKEMALEAGYKQVIMVGDFNHPGIQWTPAPVTLVNHNDDHPEVLFIDAIQEAMLHQHITEPTRYRDDQSPTIDDLILSSDPEMVDDIQYMPHIGASDHITVTFALNFLYNKQIPTQQKRYKYNKANIEEMASMLDIDWAEEFKGKSVEEAYNQFLDRYSKACKQSIPTETINQSDKFIKPVWMRPATLRLIKKKQNAHIKFLNTKKEIDRQRYKQCRNVVTHNIRNDRICFERNISKEIKNNNKAFWRYVNATRKTKANIPDLERKDGTMATTDLDKAQTLNQQFSSVFTDENIDNMPQMEEIHITNPLTDITITTEMVKKKLDKLRTDKSPGPDEVHPLILKQLSHVLAEPLTIIYNNSLQSGQVPTKWKEGVVTAIYKKGKKSSPSNYRPISLTSIICKMLEHIMTDHIKQHAIINNTQDKAQHGFTTKKSTTGNLIEALNVWTEALSHGLPVDVVYLDFEKAFDKVPHERLLNQLERYGIKGNILQWIRDYLSNRQQRVRVNGVYSDSIPVRSGVPQGSVLGPALFLIFVADVSSIVQNFISLFADDTKLYSYIIDTETDGHHTPTSIQTDINTLVNWCDNMQMSYNIEKCHTLHLGSKNKSHQYTMYKQCNTRRSTNSISYDLVFHKLEEVEYEKDLGVIIDRNLNFRKHISTKINKANSLLHLIKHTFKYLDINMFNQLYKGLIRPHLEYASPAWSPSWRKDIENLEKVQRRATRMIPMLQDLTYPERLQHLQLPTLAYRRLRIDLLLMYKLSHNLITLDSNTYCTKCKHNTNMLTPSNSITTRGHNIKYQIQHHHGIRNRFFTTRVIKHWNSLHTDTVNAHSINTFKLKLSQDLSMPSPYKH